MSNFTPPTLHTKNTQEAIREPASKEELRFLRTIEAVQDEVDKLIFVGTSNSLSFFSPRLKIASSSAATATIHPLEPSFPD